MTDLNVTVHVFCYYKLAIILIFAVLELSLIQHYLNCEQFFFYIICIMADNHCYNSSQLQCHVDPYSVYDRYQSSEVISPTTSINERILFKGIFPLQVRIFDHYVVSYCGHSKHIFSVNQNDDNIT